MVLEGKIGVYLIVSPSNKRYVGSSKRLDKRFNRYKNGSCSRQSYLYNSIKKYGYEAHKVKVLMYCKEDERLFWERVFGDMYLSSANFPSGMNLMLPAYADVPASISQSFRDKISKTQKERFKDPAQRLNTSITTKQGFTDEVREKICASQKKRYDNPEVRKQRSEARIRYYKNNPEVIQAVADKQREVMATRTEVKQKCVGALINWKKENPNSHSETMKKRFADNPKLREQHGERMRKLYINNPEKRKLAAEKTKEQIAKNGHNMSKKVINTETGEVFPTVKAACKSYGLAEETFSKMIRGLHKKTIPYKFL